MAAACAFCSVAAVAYFALIVVAVLGIAVHKDTVEVRVATSYAVVDCAPPSSAGKSRGGFREKVLPLLAALPAAAATAASPGFASLRSDDRSAFVRGICLGFDVEKDCGACLAAAAKNLTDSCLGASRRGGVWRGEGCFVAYADANTSSAREEAFRKVVFAGEDPGGDPNCLDTRRLVALAQSMARGGAADAFGAQEFRPAAALARSRVTPENTVRVFPDVARVETKVRVVAQCARDRDRAGAAECARCLGEAARRVPTCSWGLDGWHVRVADVLGYGCFLRVETKVPPVRAETWLGESLDVAIFVLLPLVAVAAPVAAAAAALGL